MNPLQRIQKRITPEERATMENNMAIANQIHLLLKRAGMTQKDLSIKLGKSQSEVSKILSGFHNLTTPTISKIQVALGQKIIMTCDEAKKEYIKFVQLTVPAIKPNGIDTSTFTDIGVARKKQGPMKVA